MSLKQNAISGAKWTGFSTLVLSFLQIGQLAVLARLLDPSAFGLMGMVMVVIGFAQAFSDMGISNAIIHRQNTTEKQLSSLYFLNLIAGLSVFVMITLSAPLIVAFYKEPRLASLIFWVSLIFLVTPFGQQFQIIFQKKLLFNKLAKVEIMTAIVGTTFTIVLAYLRFGVMALVWGQLIRAILKSVYLVILGRQVWWPILHFDRSDLKGYVGFGFYQMGERTINYFNSNLDYLVIGRILGAEALGYYTLAFNLIILPITKLNPIITKVAFPVFSKIQTDLVRLKIGYLQIVSILSFANFPLFFGLFITAPILIPVVFGEQWVPSILLTQILTGVGILRSIANPTGSLLLARGRADLGFKWNLALLSTQFPGILLGVYLGGIKGVAIAFLILQSIYSIFNYLILIRATIGYCKKEYLESLWPYFWMSGVMAMGVWGISELLIGLPQKIELLIQVLFGVIIYGILVFLFKKPMLNELKTMLGKKKAIKAH